MRSPSEHIKLLQRRVDFLKSREHQNSYDLAEIGSLEWALANLPTKQEQGDPVAKHYVDGGHIVYPKLRPRTWIGLTDEEIEMIESGIGYMGKSVTATIKEAEAKLKEKNT